MMRTPQPPDFADVRLGLTLFLFLSSVMRRYARSRQMAERTGAAFWSILPVNIRVTIYSAPKQGYNDSSVIARACKVQSR